MFHLYDVLEKVKLKGEKRDPLPGAGDGRKRLITKGHKGTSRAMDMFYYLIMEISTRRVLSKFTELYA